MIAIRHLHPSTVRALHKLIPHLPPDIELVSPGYMLTHAGKPSAVKTAAGKTDRAGQTGGEGKKPWLTPMTEQCEVKQKLGGEVLHQLYQSADGNS